MGDGFNLDNLREGVKDRTEELSEDARMRSLDGSDVEIHKPFTFEEDDHDRIEAPKDNMRKYWRQFETTPVVRKPITSFASRVTEPGYYIESKELEEDEVEELGNWLDQCAIIEGQPGKDFRQLAKKAIVQREIRGTAFVEKAPHRDDEEKIAGLKLINAETMEAVTRPQQNILMPPDAGNEFPDAPEAQSSGKAAWLQDILETDELYWGTPLAQDNDGDLKIGFRRDEVIPLTRDADVGEVFGTSRLEAVSPRIEGLKQKLQDNDEAIKSKAYPLWLFLFGDPETTGVWDSDDINEFMKSHEMENFHPGMKQGVRGDVSVETISGEVSDIAEYLNFDIQWIMASMPMPAFLLGSFSEGATTGQIAGVAQQQDVLRQIEEARRELEEEFTPVLREVAEQKGIGKGRAEDIKLRFGKPGAGDPEVTRSQQVIRYVSDAQGGGTQTAEDRQRQQQQQQQQQPADQPQTGSPKNDGVVSKGETPGSVSNPAPDQQIAGVDEDANPYVDIKRGEQNAAFWESVWDADSYEELAGVVDEQASDELARDINQLFLSTRDEALDKIGERYSSTPSHAAVEYERIANRALDQTVREARLRHESREILKDEVQEVADNYGNATTRFGQSQNVGFFAQSIENAVRDAAEEMLRRVRVHVRNGVVSGESWSDVRERVEDEFNEARLSERASLIAHMELKSAVETTKLQQFEADPDVIGVRVVNTDASTPFTQSVHGAEAYFENEKEIDNQIAAQADTNKLHKGFDPLPRVPPYHFNDTTTLEPIYE